ncbi:protein SUPPRESSOR OF PHYA 1-like isoform X1 [Capsicum annuum]|uniref:protein SUPPRESSOR OF PHYA-105 1-like isoform X1 n=3 Tax=Capsicum annuum TaxID=4072 RepID=UPI001FB05A5B|nr:protein SUPPRESSOR OF PHYA-105 1-like isoform X1 [Capsicum annuum]XP_047253929.1 protein SUPPRESSOR OF PHYA-105 1-like isoform X1 [Capsicum annuum]XP_047253930.1 protein SUPPRESSOR OF PHYA-105 1-like isoform X1 [Capsicum annuum]XP_047253931.1 protein SUPPRESSOR OF PHYA-105 1-like isoform X1 [Capsicum annuum]XP_047253932.1 protein SUPPRESSOR OF PHYA-105 1-like isoform X1 [Capsicum annuum]XP_047253933.1 protein SUPPRESSOR OF PHYA-105 1-like isoform X1 [Capsicum annuum]XP_047253934.1 protein 
MDRSKEEIAANDVAANALPKTRECAISVGPSIGKSTPTSHKLPKGSTSASSGMLDSDGMNRNVTSMKGPQSHGRISYSLNSSRLTVEKLCNYKISEPASRRCSNNQETNQKPQIQWQRFYQSGAGSRILKGDGDPSSMNKAVQQSSSKELPGINLLALKMLKHASDKDIKDGSSGMSSQSTEDHNLIIPNNRLLLGNSQSKLLSTSSFSQFFANRSLKGKNVLQKAPALHKEVHTPSSLRNENKFEQASTRMVSSDAVFKPDGNSNQASFNCSDHRRPTSTYKGVTLREWLNLMGSQINKTERIHIFRQIVKLIDIAHSEGIAFQDIRPSCFILLSPNGVKYIGPSVQIDSTYVVNQNTNGKRPSNVEMLAKSNLGSKQQKVNVNVNLMRQQPDYEGTSFKAGCRLESDINQLEKKWYTCPGELNHTSLASSNIYSLGVLFFELLCYFESPAARSDAMLNLQSRVLPPNFLSQNPKEVGFCFLLLHPVPSSRPTTREILQSELIFGAEEVCKVDGVPSYIEKDDDPDSEILLHFLVSLQEEKQNNTSKLLQRIDCLEADIKDVVRKDAPRNSDWVETEFNNMRQGSCFKHLNSTDCISRSVSITSMSNEKLMKNISQLENAYFCMRSQLQLVENDTVGRTDTDLLTSRDRLFQVSTKEAEPIVKSVDRVGAFFEGICKYARYCKFEEYGTLRNGDLLNSTNVICSLCFDHEEDYIAAAGVSKKIKIFEFASLLNESADLQYPVAEMSNRSKLSCVAWNNYMKNYLASTDYDGIVKIWDASTCQEFSQHMEHQKRAWSVDFCQVDPTKFSTGSDDCSVKVWTINERSSVDTIWNPANICCVQFSAYSSHLLAFGSADYKIYCYDLRHTRIPWCTLSGHEKAVSYVTFLDYGTMVSASTDNTLKLWDLTRTSLEGLSSNACSLTFKGHTNEKNFVGLSVLDGYIACGSESNEVYAYHRSLPMPITSYKFGSVDSSSGNEGDSNGQFVSSVCWRRKSNMIVASNSTGCIKLLRLV